MQRLKQIYSSVIGKKFIVAITGVILLGFLLGHIAGNLKVFLPHVEHDGVVTADIDVYGEHLRHIGEPMVPENAVLWGARSVLLLALVLHVVTVIQLSLINMAARPVGYQFQKTRAVSLSARYMMVTGSILLAFIVFHLLHFTIGVLPLGDFEHGKVYSNLQNSFLIFPVGMIYVAAMAVVGFHLYHGIWSLFQTLGLDNPDRNPLLRWMSVIIAGGLFLGFSSIPLAFMFGMLPDSPQKLDSTPTGITQNVETPDQPLGKE